MYKTCITLLFVAFGLVDHGITWAGDVIPQRKPLAVVSVASYERLISNIELVSELTGRPALADGLQGAIAVMTQGRGLSGVDRGRPWGIVLEPDSSPSGGVGGYLFLPVSDLAQIKELLQLYAEPIENLDEGVWKVRAKQRRQTIYVKHSQAGWLFVSDTPARLTDVPLDPITLLGDLPTKYDVALRADFGGVPDARRDEAITRLRQRAERNLTQRPGEDSHDYSLRKTIGEQSVRALLALVGDAETLTAGWVAPRGTDAGPAVMELEMSVRNDSSTSRALSQWTQAQRRFAGFRLPGAALSGGFAARYRLEQVAWLDELVAAMRARAFADIDARQSSAADAEASKQLVAGLLDVVRETLAGGQIDEVSSVILTPHQATLVSARHVSDAAKLERTLQQFVDAVRREHPEFVQEALQLPQDAAGDVRCYTLTLDVPFDAPNRDKTVQLVGEHLELVVGIGEQSVYLAAGRDAMTTLQEAIRNSTSVPATSAASESESQIAPLSLSWALRDTIQIIAATGQGKPQERASQVLVRLENTATNGDHVNLSVRPTQQSVSLRLELEPGAQRVLQEIHKTR